MIIESQRISNSKEGIEKAHQDHIADRSQVSMSHYKMVHTTISIFERNAMDRDFGKWRTRQVSPCGTVDRTLPQLRTSQVTHDSSATIASEIMLTALPSGRK